MENATNATTTVTSNIIRGSSPSHYLWEVEYILTPLLLLLGGFGNSLTIIVMRSATFRRLPVSKLLMAMSLSDVVLNLMLPLNKSFVHHMIGIDVRALSSGGCKLFFWINRLAKTTSSWLIVLITVERFIAVWLPMRAKFINTDRNVCVALILLYGMLAVFFGYWCSWADRVIDNICIMNSRPPGFEHLSEIFLLGGLLLYSFIPSIILLIFNGLIIYKLATRRKRIAPESNTTNSTSISAQPRSVRNTHTAPNSKTSVMLISVAMSFVVLVTPNAVANIVSFIRKETMLETTDPVTASLREAAQILEQLSHSVNFILYVLCNKRFRDGVITMFKINKTHPNNHN
ncbi:hypothetical protein LSH36_152g01027 [Paralvinella palmiformis]|uniref:G-protein coupled receptors family 1 profile domain-containing protein n=1 Tax=Paralvinella palmiformis TaxID=53620 RepID=A0AAD9JVK0_9ANNE|nr:hypothetical protein LSH36_152g01027 [Paralvinella palmiformis]